MNAGRSLLSKGEANDAAQKLNLTSRRRQSSIPNAKAPMGPRPLDIPAGKRSVANPSLPTRSCLAEVSQNRSISHSMNSEPNSDNDAPAAASQDQPAPQFSIDNISRFSFASIIQQDSTTDNDDVQEDS